MGDAGSRIGQHQMKLHRSVRLWKDPPARWLCKNASSKRPIACFMARASERWAWTRLRPRSGSASERCIIISRPRTTSSSPIWPVASDRPQSPNYPRAEQILGNFDQLERSLADDGFRGCPFVNAVAELKEPGHAANKIALTFKDQSRTWFRELLSRLEIANPESLAMQLMLLVDGAIAAAVVRRDPKMARTAREAARVLLVAAGVHSPAVSANREQPLKRRPHRGSSRRSAV